MFTKQYTVISHLYSRCLKIFTRPGQLKGGQVGGEQEMVGEKVFFQKADCSHDLINLVCPRLINNLYLLVT